jgi:hypothetical protein
MINKDIKKLEEIIKQNGDCHGIFCSECPLQKICSSYNWYKSKETSKIRFKNKNEAKRILRKLKLEKIIKIKMYIIFNEN